MEISRSSRPSGCQRYTRPVGIVQAGLALIGEVQTALRVEHQIVDALEGFAVSVAERGLHAAGRIEALDAVAVVGDPYAAVGMHCQPVGPAIGFEHAVPLQVRRDAKQPAMRDIGHIQIALRIEARPLEEGIGHMPRPIGVGP